MEIKDPIPVGRRLDGIVTAIDKFDIYCFTPMTLIKLQHSVTKGNGHFYGLFYFPLQ